jgi:hypothetical protein
VDNPHRVTKTQVGLDQVDNTSDLDKPISTATQTALNGKLGRTENAVSATKLQTARTINGVPFDGTANITVVDNTKAPISSPALIGTPTAPTPAAGDNSTKIATTAFVQANAGTTWVANDTRAKTALNASGTAPIYACRAWVNFNGTGTVAIRASGNVSSITDNGVGNYTVNFITPMPDNNYSVAGMGMLNRRIQMNDALYSNTHATTWCRVRNTASDTTLIDDQFIGITIFR